MKYTILSVCEAFCHPVIRVIWVIWIIQFIWIIQVIWVIQVIMSNKPIMKSTMVLWIWGHFGTLHCILAMVAFFIPFFGFDVLFHWRAEQIPFRIR